METPTITLRPATRADIPQILDFIRGLAEYEKLAHEAVATPALLEQHLFGPRPAAEVVIAEADGTPAGFALFFHSFSTFLGQPGLYLEDLFVYPRYRGLGLGKRLMVHLARLAVERGCGRFEWSVLDWNTPAIGFYESLGATPQDLVAILQGDEAAFARAHVELGVVVVRRTCMLDDVFLARPALAAVAFTVLATLSLTSSSFCTLAPIFIRLTSVAESIFCTSASQPVRVLASRCMPPATDHTPCCSTCATSISVAGACSGEPPQ